VADRWILNASPLIVLARIRHEHLFQELAQEVVIPRAVAEEIEAGPAGDRARQVVTSGQFPVVDAAPSPEILTWDLGIGETAVLSLAPVKPGWTVILDDAAARKCARSFDLPLKGTLAVVILAKQRGLIPLAGNVLHTLLRTGFWLDDQVIREALSRTVGEAWDDV